MSRVKLINKVNLDFVDIDNIGNLAAGRVILDIPKNDAIVS